MPRGWLLATAVLCSTACSPEATMTAPSQPSTSSIASGAGLWVGSVSDPAEGEGGAQLSLTEVTPSQTSVTNTGALTGTWVFTFRNGTRLAGLAEGALGSGSVFGLILTPAPYQDCQTRPGSPEFVHYQLTDAVVTASRITAVLVRMTCAQPTFGTATLVRQ